MNVNDFIDNVIAKKFVQSIKNDKIILIIVYRFDNFSKNLDIDHNIEFKELNFDD